MNTPISSEHIEQFTQNNWGTCAKYYLPGKPNQATQCKTQPYECNYNCAEQLFASDSMSSRCVNPMIHSIKNMVIKGEKVGVRKNLSWYYIKKGCTVFSFLVNSNLSKISK